MSPDLTEPTPATELAREQAYFNVAARHRDQKLADLAALPEAGPPAAPRTSAPCRRRGRGGRRGGSAWRSAGSTTTGEKTYGRHLIRDGASGSWWSTGGRRRRAVL